MGAIRFDISLERLVAAVTGPQSTMMAGQFFEANEHFRNYYASLFLNCMQGEAIVLLPLLLVPYSDCVSSCIEQD